MKILLLGGTGWVSGHVARIALEQGHAVTCLARHETAVSGARSVLADRDTDGAYDVVAQEQWDAVIDVATEPGHVRRAVRALASVAQRYIYVSTVSVYADNAEQLADEHAERLSALASDAMASMAEYGRAKVACEDAVLEAFGTARSLIARPGLIGGPGDATGRTTYWPWRFANPAVAEVIAVPDAGDLITAIIDARDLAAWLVRCVRDKTTGIFNVLGTRMTFAEHLAIAREVGVADGGAGVDDPKALPITPEFLREHDVNEWSGKKSMPLWIDAVEMAHMSNRTTDRALAAGLMIRPLADTLRDGIWWRSNNGGVAGMSDPDERAIVAAWRAR